MSSYAMVHKLRCGETKLCELVDEEIIQVEKVLSNWVDLYRSYFAFFVMYMCFLSHPEYSSPMDGCHVVSSFQSICYGFNLMVVHCMVATGDDRRSV